MPRRLRTSRPLATLHGAKFTLSNLGSNTRQGDYAFFGLCEKLGAQVSRAAGHTVIEGPRELRASFEGPVDMTSMPDVAPTLMMIAPFLETPTRITGLATLRVKECDRIAAPTRELRKLGVTVEEGPDYMVIAPLANPARPKVVEIETYHDHRIAMVLRCAGITPAGPANPRPPAASPRRIRTIGATGNARAPPAGRVVPVTKSRS